MRSARAPLATVLTAERAAPHRPTEDRIFLTDDAVVVLDGASQPESNELDGGWMADTLGRELQSRLASGHDDLVAIVSDAIADVAHRHNLAPGASPSTTVSIVRWTEADVDVLVLGDSPVVAHTVDGDILQIRDQRLQRVGAEQRKSLKAAPSSHRDVEHRRSWRTLVETERANRNKLGGYWIAEAVPEAASHARRTGWKRHDVAELLVMTDGVSAGVDRYGIPPDWPTAFALASHDPAELVEMVHNAERSDPECARWPRTKPYDDKAVAHVRFDHR